MDEGGVIAEEAAETILNNLGRVTSLLVGPGFGVEETTKIFLQRMLNLPVKGKKVSLPNLVVDADGLKLLANIHDWPRLLPAQTVLTPHPGEMAVLTGMPIAKIQADRIYYAEFYAREWNHIVVLKGAFTVVADPSGQTAIIQVASPE